MYPGEGTNQFELVSQLTVAISIANIKLSFYQVHINDLVDLIFKVYDFAYTSTDPQRARYYIASVHRYTSKELAELAAPALFRAGIVASLEAKTIGLDEIGNSPADQ